MIEVRFDPVNFVRKFVPDYPIILKLVQWKISIHGLSKLPV